MECLGYMQSELAHVQDDWMAKRRQELNDVLVENERRLEREKHHTAEKCKLETDIKRASLERQLEVDRAEALRDIEVQFQVRKCDNIQKRHIIIFIIHF